MPKAYWVICHRSTRSPEKFAAFTKLAYPAIRAAGGQFLVRTSNVAKTHESGLNDRTVVIEFENPPKPWRPTTLRTTSKRWTHWATVRSGTCASSKASSKVVRARTPIAALLIQRI